jgi:hypothetical protein
LAVPGYRSCGGSFLGTGAAIFTGQVRVFIE